MRVRGRKQNQRDESCRPTGPHTEPQPSWNQRLFLRGSTPRFPRQCALRSPDRCTTRNCCFASPLHSATHPRPGTPVLADMSVALATLGARQSYLLPRPPEPQRWTSQRAPIRVGTAPVPSTFQRRAIRPPPGSLHRPIERSGFARRRWSGSQSRPPRHTPVGSRAGPVPGSERFRPRRWEHPPTDLSPRRGHIPPSPTRAPQRQVPTKYVQHLDQYSLPNCFLLRVFTVRSTACPTAGMITRWTLLPDGGAQCFRADTWIPTLGSRSGR